MVCKTTPSALIKLIKNDKMFASMYNIKPIWRLYI